MNDKALLRRALELHKRGAYTEALGLFTQLSKRHPDGTPIGRDCAFYGGLAAYELRSHAPQDLPVETAITLLERAAGARPHDVDVWVSLGHMNLEAGRPGNARDCYLRALQADPGRLKAQAELGYAYLDLGLRARGRWCVELAAGMEASTPRDRYHRAIARLALGTWADGWADYEARFELPSWRLPDTLRGIRRGLGGRQLLYCEQGVGDTLMALRWVPALLDQVDHLTLLVPSALGRLLDQQWPAADVCTLDDPLPAVDRWCSTLSLPLLLGAPGDEPYLAAPDPGPRPARMQVGIVWAGNASHKNDLRRSTPLADWAPVLAVPELDIISLQVGAAAAELAGTGGVINLAPELGDWLDTAAALRSLDLLITVDTGIGHLAGALGVPCWTLLASAPDWRWGLEADVTPWYRAHRLFRQERVGSWSPVLERVASELAALSSHRLGAA